MDATMVLRSGLPTDIRTPLFRVTRDGGFRRPGDRRSDTIVGTAKMPAVGHVPASRRAAQVWPAVPARGLPCPDGPTASIPPVSTPPPQLPASFVAPPATPHPTTPHPNTTRTTAPPTAQEPGFAYLALSREAAFDAVFDREKARLFHLAFSVLHDRAEAEDAVQETMWKAWRAWQTVRDERKRNAWLTKICLRHCLRRKQRLDRSTPWDTTDPDTADRGMAPGLLVGAAASISPPVNDPDLDRAYRNLPPKQRAAIVLHYHHGYTVEQTAEVMGCRAGTVRTHVQRALANLRKELGNA